MSGVPPSITTDSLEIPRPRRDEWRPDPHDLSQTPGGTLYATTPGGTKIVYNRDKLMALAQSPLSKSPLNLPYIPGITSPGTSPSKSVSVPSKAKIVRASDAGSKVADDDLPFDFET